MEGMDIEHISKKTGRSKRTVEMHFRHIKEKLNCKTIYQIPAKALKYGLSSILLDDHWL